MKTARLSKKATMRLVTAGAVLIGLTAPALASHFEWSATPPEGSEPVPVTAEGAHVTCPEPAEGQDAEAAKAACDAAVASVAAELTASEHPENHGKYVSFTAHCLKGMKGKGQMMKTVAQASEEEQMGLAVMLCSEFRLSDDSTETSKVKGSGDDVEVEESDSDAEGEEEKKSKSASKGKGRGKKK